MICEMVRTWDVVSRDRFIFREHDVGAGSAAGIADVEVRRIGVGSKDHVVGTIGDAVVGAGYALVKELVDTGRGGFCGSGPLGENFAEGMQEFVVDSTGTVQDSSENALDVFDSGVVKGKDDGCVISIFDFGAIVDRFGFVGGKLAFLRQWVVVIGE